ncbi:MAG: hypothetical protein AB1813_21770 [Verrucomicrobiota bacterium]|jgi:hypothetical protein
MNVIDMDTPTKRGSFGDTITGFFRRSKASANSIPRLVSPKRTPYGPFQFQINLTKGATFEVQATTDLRHWETLGAQLSHSETTEFLDSNAPRHNLRFYRVLAGGTVSTNVIGYVSVTLPPGHAMISNPLLAQNNRVEALFPDLPEGTTFDKFDTTLFKLTKNGVTNGVWTNPQEVLLPGEGAIILNPTSDVKTLNFVGEVPQGDLSLPIPAGFSIRSSLLPLPGALDTDLGFPITNGDVIHLFDREQQKYIIYTFEQNRWTPSQPVIASGEAFWVGKTAAGNWVQSAVLNRI